jgi:hypothetical protein
LLYSSNIHDIVINYCSIIIDYITQYKLVSYNSNIINKWNKIKNIENSDIILAKIIYLSFNEIHDLNEMLINLYVFDLLNITKM